MALYTKLNEIVKRYKNDILIIQDFVNSTHRTLESLSEILHEHKGKITDEDRNILKSIAEVLKEAASEMEGHRPKTWTKTIQTTGRANQILLAAAKKIKSQSFFSEMVLSYLISFQEGFVKDYLEEILSHHPQLLKSNKSLSYEDAMGFGSIQSLRRHLVRSETESLGYRSIDDLGTYLLAKFNIIVQEEPFWPRVREASYRRNLIVHNRGMVNDRYLSKLGVKTSEATLKTDRDYVIGVSSAVTEFMQFMHDSIVEKLKIKKPIDRRMKATKLAKRATKAEA